MNLQQVKQGMVGAWVSLAPEIRPSANKNPDGSLKPFYLRREFKYLEGDVFELTVVNSADPYGAAPWRVSTSAATCFGVALTPSPMVHRRSTS